MKIAFYTLGCKVNQYETEVMREKAQEKGFTVTEPDASFDVLVINSCTVTAESDRKVRQTLRHYRRKNPSAVIVLTGCMVQAFPNESGALGEADIIIGNRNISEIVEKVEEFLANKTPLFEIIPHKNGDEFNTPSIYDFAERTRAYIKIEDGCNRYCSYCIIPYARGFVRSKPIAEIEKEIKVKTAELQKVMKQKAGVISAKNAIAIDDVVLTDAEKAAIDARDAAIAAVSADIKENLKNMTAASKELKKVKKSFGEESAEFIAANNKVNTLKTKQLQLRAEETKLLNSKTAYQQIKAEVGDSLGVKYRDHSIFMMITGLIILIISIIFIVLYVYNIINAKKTSEIILKNGYPTMAQTKKGMEQTAFPAIGIIPLILMISFFTLIPLLFSALVAFTNYSTPNHIPPANLVDWVGFRSFADMFASTGADGGANTWATAFGSIAIWTVIWAVFATFTCFFVGFFFAVILQDKRVSIPRFYRTVFILPYAIPTMLSLFIWANLLNGTFGPINRTLQIIGLMKQGVPWLTNPTMAKVTLILVNIWIGFPYSMILTTSSMTAIPNSLYEAAVIDGATKFKQFTSITFPLVMFQTGPLLIMQFASNINNFGAVFFLTGGGPNLMLGAGQNAVNATITTQAGATDLLISWIYKLTMNSNNYNTASVLSILVFIVLVPFAVFQFTRTKSFKDGEI